MEIKTMANKNKKIMFVMNPDVIRIAKTVYKGGQFLNASNSAFMRDLVEEGIKLYKKVKK